MNFFAKLCMRVLPFVFSVSVVCAEDTFFKHSVTTEKKPWTAKKFLNDPADFQFAIVSDRTGGPRVGVFPKAVDKLNELRPEFVITVGDMIRGGQGEPGREKVEGPVEGIQFLYRGLRHAFLLPPGKP